MTEDSKSKPGAGASRMDTLQTPFNLRLYGRLIEGVEVKQEHLHGRIGERSTRRGPAPSAADGAKQHAMNEAAAEFQVAPSEARLANIYGYARGNTRTILPRPLTILVDDDGQAPLDWDNQFSNDAGFRCWEVEPDETTYRFDVRLGSFGELLAREAPDESVADTSEPEGGTLIRGADNRLYLIPLALEPFEVRDPREVSDLQIQAQYGREIKVDSVRSVTGRSTLVARSTLQVRSTLTLRSTLAAAGR